MAAKVVSILNLKGGVGKTTLAMFIAEYMVFKFLKRVLVIDLDSQANLTSAMVSPADAWELGKNGPTIYHLFKTFLNGEKPNMTDFVAPNSVQVSNIARLQPGISLDMVVSSPAMARLDEEMIDPWENDKKIPPGIRLVLKDALASTTGHYDAIIIDCPPGLSLFTTAAIVASDYFVSPIIPEPLSILGINLIQDRIAELKTKPDLGVKIANAGCVLSKVLHYRNAHAVESALMYGVPAGGRPPYARGHYNPFHWWVPDAEHLRKLGNFTLDLFEQDARIDIRWVHGKYGGTWVTASNPKRGGPLDRSSEEGVQYQMSTRLERVTKELMDKTGI